LGQRLSVGILGVKEIPGVMGADRVVESLLHRLPADNQYVVYVTRTSEPRPARISNVRFVRVPALKGKHLRAASYFALCSLHAAVVGRYDVVHVHNSDFGAFCLPLRLRRSARLIATFHGDPYLREKWGHLAKAFLRFSEWCFVQAADVITSVSPTKRITDRTVHYIPNGVDAQGARAADCLGVVRKLGLARDEFVMFACGRLDPTKGLHHVIQAYSAIETDAKLLAVGDFSHDARYAASVEAAARGDRRIALHKTLLPREELLAAVARCAVFVFPSEVEGMSMMLLEAISCGATVVCSDIPENLELVGSDYPFLFRNKRPEALREALERAMKLRDKRATDRLRESVLARFSWERAARSYAELYNAA
jgi:glycosyltransferase involved in cell wall biosynthesis